MHAIFTCEKPNQRDQYRQVLINSGIECGADDSVVYGDFLSRFNRGGADILVFLTGSDPDETLKMVQSVHEKSSLPILIVGPSHDAQLIMQSMKAGAREYIDVNQVRSGLLKALEKLRQTNAIQFRRGRSIMVTGAVPGSGVTTVASGLSFALGARHPKQVLLGELGSGVPELALDLDLKLRNSVTQLLRDWDRVDASTIRQALVEHPAGIAILADIPATELASPAESGAARQLVSLIRSMYDYAIYDIGHGVQTLLAQEAIQIADRVVVVVRLDVPSLSLTRNLINRLSDMGMPQENLIVVANRYGQRKQVAWKKVEQALGVKVNVWVPDDPATVNHALNLGLSLTQVSSWAKIIRRLDELAQHVNGTLKQ